jgi:hypothetical protein
MTSAIPNAPPLVLPWQQLLWGALTLAIFLSWLAFFAKKFRNDLNLPESILAAFVATFSQILATMFILGFLNQIYWWPLYIFNFIIFAAITALSISGDTAYNIFKIFGRLLYSSVPLMVIAIIAIFSVLWHIYFGQLMPPMASDSWAYHLPWAALVHQEGNLGPFDIPSSVINYYPMNTEMLFTWTLIGDGTDRWANIVQIPFAIASVLSCYLIARNVGAKRYEAAICGLLILSVPTVLHMMSRALVDVACMGAGHIAFAFLTRKKLSPVALTIAGLSTGFLLGGKGSSVYVFIPIVMLLIYRLFFTNSFAGETGAGHSKKYILKTAIIFFGLAFLFGSYFYLRNWILVGNPTGDFMVKVAGITLFRGEHTVEESIFFRNNVGPEIYDRIQETGNEWPIVLDGFYDPAPYIHTDKIGGWGAPWTTLLLPAIPIAILISIFRKKWNLLFLLAMLILPYFLFYYNHISIRFHLHNLVVGTTAFAVVLSELRGTRFQRPVLVIAAISMLFGVFIASSPKPSMTDPQDLAWAKAVRYEDNYRYTFFKNLVDPNFQTYMETVQQPGSTFALSDPMSYGMNLGAWNPTFTNRVVWVGWDGDGLNWEARLMGKGADAVYVAPNSPPLRWAMDHPDNFELVFNDESDGGIFKIVNPHGD